MQFQKATKAAAKLRLALVGPSGSGKTFTALSLASNLAKKIAVVDTEHGSASKYADLFDFDALDLDSFSPQKYIDAINIAQKAGYQALVIDSLSHAWIGRGGVLEMHGDAEKRTKNSFAAWRDVTPEQNRLIETILQSDLHVIATMRAKTEYSMDKDDRGKTQVKSVGLAPVQRDGMEYEFDVVAHLDHENNFIVQKTRCPALSGKIFNRAGADVAGVLEAWLEGTPPATKIRMDAAPENNFQPAAKPASAAAPTAPPHRAANGEDPKPDTLENSRLVDDITAGLDLLNRNDGAFNQWYQKEYDSTMNWRQASLGVKRELLAKVTGWAGQKVAA